MYFDPALEELPLAETAARLRSEIGKALPSLLAIPDAEAARSLAVGKWSRKQVLGHLIDSAANNHQRFVRAQEPSVGDLPGYAQEHWVSVQGYQERPWQALVELWSAYNQHLAHVVERIPETGRGAACRIGGAEPVTLAYVASDYVGHLQHHLRQIFASG